MLAVAALIAVAAIIYGGWQLWNGHSKFSDASERQTAISENIGRVMSYNEDLRM